MQDEAMAVTPDALQPPPDGHDLAIVAATGCTPREALSGPMPPGWTALAKIAGPMLDWQGDWRDLAAAMSEGDATEWAWRDALLPFFPEVNND